MITSINEPRKQSSKRERAMSGPRWGVEEMVSATPCLVPWGSDGSDCW